MIVTAQILQQRVLQQQVSQKAGQMASYRYVWLLIITAFTIVGCNGATDRDAQTADLAKVQTTQIERSTLPPSLNVVSPDWGIAATLAAIGTPPIATGDMRVWDQWVGNPALPPATQDLGIRYLPNAELIAQLPADLLVDNFFYEHSRNLYAGSVPTESVMFKSEQATATWADYVKPTRALGQYIHQPQLADDYIAKSRQDIKQAGARFHQRYPKVKTFAVVQFVDANNLRMYAHNSLFNAVFTQMNRELVALDKGNDWGYVALQMGDLAQLEDDVCLLIVEPLNPITEAQLADSLVWQRLGYGSKNGHSRCMAKLPPVWIYGGIPSMTRLAHNVANADLIGGVAL